MIFSGESSLILVFGLIIVVYVYLVQLERGLHGLEPVAVANFPTKKYGEVFFTSAEDAQ